MGNPLAARTIAVLERRELAELTRLIEKEGGRVLPVPMIRIDDNPHREEVRAWIDGLIQGKFDPLVMMTGEGILRLHNAAVEMGVSDAFRGALRSAVPVLRGPKPARALKKLDLPPGKPAPWPTTDGVIEALRGVDLRGKTVGVQTFPEADPGLAEFVRSAGGEVREVLPYAYAADCPDGEVVGLIDALGRGEVDALAVTSSPQVARLFEVAEARGKSGELSENLKRTCVAAVGPVAERGLRERDVRVDVRPERGGFVMKRLVEHIKRHFAFGRMKDEG